MDNNCASGDCYKFAFCDAATAYELCDSDSGTVHVHGITHASFMYAKLQQYFLYIATLLTFTALEDSIAEVINSKLNLAKI